MSRSDVSIRVQNEANTRSIDNDPGPIIRSISQAERTFRWMSTIRNEPKFELAQVSGPDGSDFPDRAA